MPLPIISLPVRLNECTHCGPLSSTAPRISNLPRADAKCGHKSISHFVHENKRIGPSHRKENKRENDESMDGKTDHNCYDEQG